MPSFVTGHLGPNGLRNSGSEFDGNNKSVGVFQLGNDHLLLVRVSGTYHHCVYSGSLRSVLQKQASTGHLLCNSHDLPYRLVEVDFRKSLLFLFHVNFAKYIPFPKFCQDESHFLFGKIQFHIDENFFSRKRN